MTVGVRVGVREVAFSHFDIYVLPTSITVVGIRGCVLRSGNLEVVMMTVGVF
jgi:hypothetical protein